MQRCFKQSDSYAIVQATLSVALAAGLATAVAAPLFVAPSTGRLELGFCLSSMTSVGWGSVGMLDFQMSLVVAFSRQPAVAQWCCSFAVGPGTTERATSLRGSRAAPAAVTQTAPGATAKVGAAGAVVALAALGASGAKAGTRKPRMVQVGESFELLGAASNTAEILCRCHYAGRPSVRGDLPAKCVRVPVIL